LRRLRKDTSLSSERYYLEIDDFMLDRWEKCQKGDLRFVTKNGKSTELDSVVWVRLYNQYLERFGLGDEMEEYLNLQIHLIRLRSMWIQTKDDMLLNQIAIEEINLNQKDPSKHLGMTIDQCIVHLSKWVGYHIRKTDITIVEFKNLMTEYGRANKKE
jgi:hypothetical protein